MRLDVPGRSKRYERAIVKFEHGVNGRRCFDGNVLALARLAGDFAALARGRRKGRHPFDWSDQIDEIGDVIGSDIEDRPRARLEEEVGIGVPVLKAEAHDVACPRRHPANGPFIDQGAGLLMGTAEERVRRAADLLSGLLCSFAQILAFLEGKDQRLFGIGVLAGRDDLFRYCVVHIGNRQIDDNVEFGIGHELIGRLGRDVELIGARLCSLGNYVCNRPHLDALEQGRELEIGR